ncbi:MAG: mannose-1-phosphate guanylyltransferase [Caulobacterales bacterium]
MTIIPAILSGGAGSRLWPLSTPARPKQFHALGGADSLIQATAARFLEAPIGVRFAAPIVIANVAHEAEILAQLSAIGVAPAALILEPFGRNTAAAALIAAEAAAEIDPDALVLLLPADHRISDPAAFRAAVARAAPVARSRIVTFGIEPTGPETGYGYIQRGADLGDGAFEIARFKEKPVRALAEELWRDGRHSWNAGIFFFAPTVVREEFAHAPDVRDGALAAWRAAARDGVCVRLPEAEFAATPSAPFDVAVMEKTTRAAVAPCDIGWADLGAWDEVWRLADKDGEDNVARGPVALKDARGCLVIGDGVKVAVSGVEDLIIVATADGVVVLPKARAQDVKALLAMLEKRA